MPFFLFWGFLVWLGATLIFRFAGQFFFLTESPGWMFASYTLVVPLIFILTLPLYKFKKVYGKERLKAAIYIALPGMLIDALILAYFDQVFINLSADTDRFFASWLMWAYSIIVATGFIEKRQE